METLTTNHFIGKSLLGNAKSNGDDCSSLSCWPNGIVGHLDRSPLLALVRCCQLQRVWGFNVSGCLEVLQRVWGFNTSRMVYTVYWLNGLV